MDRDDDLQNAARAPAITKQPITFYYTRLIGTDSHIYSLYSTMPKGKEMSHSKIHVLDWEGKPVKEYILDCTLLSFDLDLENNLIYGLSYSHNDKEEAFHIVKFLLDRE